MGLNITRVARARGDDDDADPPYSPRGALLRSLREGCSVRVETLAFMIGESPDVVLDLERGAATVASDEEWFRLYELVAVARQVSGENQGHASVRPPGTRSNDTTSWSTTLGVSRRTERGAALLVVPSHTGGSDFDASCAVSWHVAGCPRIEATCPTRAAAQAWCDENAWRVVGATGRVSDTARLTPRPDGCAP